MRFNLGTVVAGLLLMIMAAPAFAQAETMHINVPFAFAGKQVLPAGKYVITSHDLISYDVRGQVSTYVLTQHVDGGKVQHQPRLISSRSGDHYSLLQICDSDGPVGRAALG